MLAVTREHRVESRRCRVLCVIAGMPAGGAERQLALLLDGLDRRAFEPGLLIFNAAEKIHYPQIFDRELWFRSLGLSGKSAAKLVWPLLAGIDRAVRDFAPDVVFATLNVANHVVRLSRLAFRWQAPVVTSVRASFTNGYRVPEKIAERILWRQSNQIVANSTVVREELISRLGAPPERVACIANGIEPLFFETSPDRPPAWWPQGARIALTIGRFSPEKNQHRLISALREIRDAGHLGDWRFVFVGEGRLEREMRSAIAEHRLEEQVLLHAPIADPASLYRAAGLVVIPSLHEGMPNVALEAQASGCPVAIAHAANLAGVVTAEAGFVLEPDLASSLAGVLALPDAALKERGEAARVRMMREFSAPTMVGRYEDLLRRVAGVAPDPRQSAAAAAYADAARR